jgi:hypothetical protein
MDLLLFPLGMLWLLFEDAEARRDGAARLSGLACIAIAALVFVGHAWTYRVEWHTAPWREKAFARAEEAMLRGGTTKEDGRAMQAPQPWAGQAVAIMRTRKLSVFRQADASTCNSDVVRWADGWYGAGQGENRWMKQAARIEVPPCSCEAKVTVYLPAGFAPRDLSVAAGDAKQTLALVPGRSTAVTLPASAAWHTATLSVSAVTLPAKDIAGSTDKRTVGALFGPLRFVCAVPAAAQ